MHPSFALSIQTIIRKTRKKLEQVEFHTKFQKMSIELGEKKSTKFKLLVRYILI